MAEEVKVTESKQEEIAKEGTMDSVLPKEDTLEPKIEEKVPETVPLAVFLDLKQDMKDLKESIKNSKDSNKSSVLSEGLEDLTKKYPDVSPEFIEDLLSSATKQATKKIEEKYTPIIKKQEDKDKQVEFDTAFDALYKKTLDENPDLPKTVNKQIIKDLAITAKYRNTPLVDIITSMYGSPDGKSSSENETRNGSDIVDEVVSFDKITDEQKKAIMADPKARTKYFSWLDEQVG